jgi:drug/metabolite transporter (DMT)-like permease
MAYMVLIGLLLMLPFYLWESLTVQAFPVTWESFSAIVFLALFASVIAHLAYNRVIELLGANRTGVISYMVLGFGVLMAIGLLGEAFEGYHAFGLVLLVAASWLVARPVRRRPRADGML